MGIMEEENYLGRIIVSYDGERFDVTDFVQKHPGGPEVLWRSSGQPIDDFMNGTKALADSRHPHSKAAFHLLRKMVVSEEQTASNDAKLYVDPIDYERPVLQQIGSLGSGYWDWIHHPVDREIRMFHSGFLEFFSRTHWAFIPLVWIPLVVYLAMTGIAEQTRLEVGLIALLWNAVLHFALGIVFWSLIEYLLHRYLFHFHPPKDSPFWLTAHFFLHGMHHKTPFDKGRLVFPPAAALPLVVLIFNLYKAVLLWHIACLVAAGTLFGYVCYDLIHYYLHHGNPRHGSYWKELKRYHYSHHFRNWNKANHVGALLYLRLAMGYLTDIGMHYMSLVRKSVRQRTRKVLAGRVTRQQMFGLSKVLSFGYMFIAWNILGVGVAYWIFYRPDPVTGELKWMKPREVLQAKSIEQELKLAEAKSRRAALDSIQAQAAS